MRRLLATSIFFASLASAQMHVDEFKMRRANLRKTLDGVLVLASRTQGRDEVFRSNQEPSFFYLTGWSETETRVLVTPTREVLFLAHHNERLEHFVGKRSSAEARCSARICPSLKRPGVPL